jgi:hypothetical protein
MLSPRKFMTQNTADCVALVLMPFPTLNLRMPEAPASRCWWEQLCGGHRVPEVTSGYRVCVCVCVTITVGPRGTQRSPRCALRIPGPQKCLGCFWAEL